MVEAATVIFGYGLLIEMRGFIISLGYFLRVMLP